MVFVNLLSKLVIRFLLDDENSKVYASTSPPKYPDFYRDFLLWTFLLWT